MIFQLSPQINRQNNKNEFLKVVFYFRAFFTFLLAFLLVKVFGTVWFPGKNVPAMFQLNQQQKTTPKLHKILIF